MELGEEIMEGFGVLSGEEGKAFAAGIEEVRKRMDREFRERADNLFDEE